MRQFNNGQIRAGCAVLAIVLPVVLSIRPAGAEDTQISLINAPIWTDINTGIAMSGYDPVSYFLPGGPTVGTARYETVWGGVAWWFASEANCEAFKEAPFVYAPRFGGHGVLTMARATIVPGRPDIWDIWQGQLYLFNTEVNREIWRRDQMRINENAVEVWLSWLNRG